MTYKSGIYAFDIDAHPVMSTKVVLEQQLPPTLSWFVRGLSDPSGPEFIPAWLGSAHGAQPVVLTALPYDRQKSMLEYMPVM